ncbi:flagellar brake protein [Ureibacillus sp. MALMAid1270]|uniref:flagellar brake protein n=1 Tax=Ureibacillus sp. MALMAid1270 TaxID=3411629 RepID=UPI003BA4ED83
MIQLEIKIGTVLTLEPISDTDKIEKFHCKLVESTDRIIYIDYPINTLTKKTAYLMDGSQFRVTFIDGEKTSYAFNTEVLGRKMDSIPMIMLSLPPDEEIIKIQRRQFVRVRTSVDVAVEFEQHYLQFVTEDISAGGLALILNSNVPFQENDQVNLTIVLPFSNGDIHYIQTQSLVVRIFELNQMKIASIQFEDIDEVDQQKLLRFCFERQLMIRKKELKTI